MERWRIVFVQCVHADILLFLTLYSDSLCCWFCCAINPGLATVYTINTALAALVAIFKAPERGQPVPLWVIKTFSVGGLAYDQLMQLPTLEELEKAKSVKGARALKKDKKR